MLEIVWHFARRTRSLRRWLRRRCERELCRIKKVASYDNNKQKNAAKLLSSTILSPDATEDISAPTLLMKSVEKKDF